MKRAILAIVFAFAIGSCGWAQEQQTTEKKEPPGMGMMGGGHMMGDKMGKGMMMHGQMMKMMMPRQMVASNDGGVIVLAGNKLYKYDKNLNLVKEAEVKTDTAGMEKMMADMKAKCPMMKPDKEGDKGGKMMEELDEDMPMPPK